MQHFFFDLSGSVVELQQACSASNRCNDCNPSAAGQWVFYLEVTNVQCIEQMQQKVQVTRLFKMPLVTNVQCIEQMQHSFSMESKSGDSFSGLNRCKAKCLRGKHFKYPILRLATSMAFITKLTRFWPIAAGHLFIR